MRMTNTMTLQFDYQGLRRIISGGQTGADQGGLEAGRKLGIETGGLAPRGWKTCRGPNPLLAVYGLVCVASDEYNVRTAANIRESDATLVIARDLASPGTIFTINECRRQKKPCHVVSLDSETIAHTRPLIENTAHFIIEHQVVVLNVAGNRDRGDSMVMFDATIFLLHQVGLVLKDDGLLNIGVIQ